MSGAEAIAVLGVISSIIAVVDGIKQVYDAATNAQGLPEAFRGVAGRLPIVDNILGSTQQHINRGDVDGDSCEGVKHVVEACEKKAKQLDDLFRKAISTDGASGLKRYYKAVKAYGKGNEVENLMKGMLEDVQLLACERGMKTATKDQQEQIVKAITEVSAIQPSVPEHEFQETGFTNTNSGSGTQYNAQGEYVAQGNAQQYNSGGGAMSFGLMEDEPGTCLTALFLTDPKVDREQLIQAKGSRVSGTCKWVKSNKLYISWLHSHSQLLWLSGGPGKGKTMLSIFLAEELERTAKNSQNVLFLQYFCDSKDEKRKTAVTVIRGLIFQLLQSRPKLINHILPSFKIQKESLFTGSSFPTLWKIFESMVCDPILGTTYCILDGLDECDADLLEVLLGKFAALLSAKTNESSACRLNLIVVSRDLPEFIPELLSSFPRIRLDPDAEADVNNDIHRFIEMKVDELSARKQYPDPLRVLVKEIFQNRAQGTFLWIGIVAKALQKYKATEVENGLDLFPSGLDELYARMLLRIDINRREIAARILRWVVMAVRPLTLSELSVAIETNVGTPGIFSRDKVITDQVSYCGYFLKIKDNKIDLIHQSAKDYLLRKSCDSNPELEFFRVKEEVSNLEIARKCLDYLQNGALAAGQVNLKTDASHLKAFPLLSYAVLHWPEHARSLARSESIFDLSLPFYHKRSPVRESWLKTYWAEKEYYILPHSFTLLHIASWLGILPLAENLLLKNGSINKVKRFFYLNKIDNRKKTALIWAAEGGHEAIIQLLLEKGADVDAKDENGHTALHEAAFKGNKAVIRLLLEKGADIKVKDKDKWTAMHAAALSGHEAIIQLLLEKGADIDAKDEDGQTVLYQAASSGHEAVIRLLLEKGADIEAKDKDKWTALHMAASFEHEAVVRLLLKNGADIEAKDKDGQTALYRAALRGHEAVVRLLLENGADIEAKNENEWTIMHTAAFFGHEAVVRLLLEKGADIEAKNIQGRTALDKAVLKGHDAVVRLLLENGADIKAKNKWEWTALHTAASNGHEAVVRLLLEKGADIEAKDIKGRTALDWATTRGHEAVVQLLRAWSRSQTSTSTGI
ncbi:MAG: hypothetical protein Q9187_005963 [Circinaria calcarea]